MNSRTTYHILIKTSYNLVIFKNNEDVEFFLHLIEKYKIYSNFIYSYCLINNTLHIIVSSNKYDIYKFINKIISIYNLYFNKKYKHPIFLLENILDIKIVKNNYYIFSYLKYINNSNCSMKFFSNRINLLNVCNKSLNKNYSPETIIEFVAKYLNLKNANYNMTHEEKFNEFNSLCVVLLKAICNLSFKEICTYLNTVSLSKACFLCDKGANLIQYKYSTIFLELKKASSNF